MKTKFILHSGFTRYDNESNRNFFIEFAQDIPNNGSVLIVLFASRELDPSEKLNDLKKKFVAGAGDKNLTFNVAEKENFLEQLKNSDAVYFQGGSTNKLLAILREYDLNDLKKLMSGKTIAGSSAGTYALIKYGPAHDKGEIREGLGVVPVRAVCHYKSSELPPNDEAVEKLRNQHTDLDLFELKDCEWVIKEIEI